MVQSWQAGPGWPGGGAMLGTTLGKGLTELLVMSPLGLCRALGQKRFHYELHAFVNVEGL